MAINTGIIADDLTGGLLVAGFLEDSGIRCPVVTTAGAVLDAGKSDALVIARRLRLAPVQQAVEDFEAAATALNDHGARQLYYKYCATFDSTDEGNIGPCADALMRLSGTDRLGFCPAFPTAGITVYQGHIFLREQLLCDSPKRFDPLTPMPDPNLVNVLARQTKYRVGLVPHAVLSAGKAAAKAHINALVSEGISYFIFDAIDDADVVTCASITADWPAMTGGDTLSQVSTTLRLGVRAAADRLPEVAGPGAVVAGSCGAATLDQLDDFAECFPVLRIDLQTAANDPAVAVVEALNWAESRVQQGPIALAISDRPDGVARIQSELGRTKSAQLGEKICGDIALGLYDLGVRRFVVAGGETSGAVAAALKIERLDVAPTRSLGGGLCYTLKPEPMTLLFKSGKMGTPDLFRRFFQVTGEYNG